MKQLAKSIDFNHWLKNSNFWITLSLCCTLALIYSAHSFLNAIIFKEEHLQNIFKKDTLTVSVESDPRKKNVFYSTVEYFKAMRSKNDDIASYIYSEAKIKVYDKTSDLSIERRVPIVLSSDNFFEKLNGNFVWGSSFTYQDFISDSPYAIVTPQVLDMLSSNGEVPSIIDIEGRSFKVIGQYQFPEADFKENSLIFLPMGAAKLIGSEKKSYLNKFLVNNADGQGLERLKKTVDEIQLSTGYVPIRPEYEIQPQAVSSHLVSVYQKNITPILYSLYFLFFSLVLTNIFMLKKDLSFYNSVLLSRIVAGWNKEQLALFIYKGLQFRYMALCGLALAITTLSIVLFKGHYDLGFSHGFGWSFLFSLSIYPILSWFVVKQAVEKQFKITFSENLFPNPSKWDLENAV